MILGGNKAAVVENIKTNLISGNYNNKAEVGDPHITSEEKTELALRYARNRGTVGYWMKNRLAMTFLYFFDLFMNRSTKVEGMENLSQVQGGAIVTSNHFNQLDNTVVRETMRRGKQGRLYTVVQESNLAMTGLLGFIMNYVDNVPITRSKKYTSEFFEPFVAEKLAQGDKILIYPEQEMWFNYRKPRPPKRGAYYYAALNHVPVISCFVEIKTLPERETEEFYRTQWVMHVLPPIYPDPEKDVRTNSLEMMDLDYRQKVAAYEQAYGKKLTYTYEEGDVAGWIAKEA
ncbi:MAG: 1-acyl-sn-glycerol-3-phosphate acyltransferase [Lachnospiraceae bacterium]|nr:1-acyl-sn-glycerol-3-phosphate acyltransferase [Lachnospiraceae bacterium]